jgi:hypothetical protein
MTLDELSAWARSRALPVAACVTGKVRPDHLIGEASREELAALVFVLAAAADQAKLRALVAAGGDGRLLPTDRALMLRTAHTEAQRLRRGHQEVPRRLGLLEREYWRTLKRKAAAKGSDRAA